MKYKVGDRVRIKSIDWYGKNKRNRGYVILVSEAEVAFTIEMSSLCGQIVTISQKVYTQDVEFYRIREDRGTYMWTDEMIEGLVEELLDNDMKEHQKLCDEIMAIQGIEPIEAEMEQIIHCPDDYIFKDENGNVINARKIVLEKKKKEYPKTYKECCKVLGIEGNSLLISTKYITDYERGLWNLTGQLHGLIICRDAYWKIAGEEMGLGKPWEPIDNSEICYSIFNWAGKIHHDTTAKWCILTFPTEEMRDAFYENFKELIEQCKELL